MCGNYPGCMSEVLIGINDGSFEVVITGNYRAEYLYCLTVIVKIKVFGVRVYC